MHKLNAGQHVCVKLQSSEALVNIACQEFVEHFVEFLGVESVYQTLPQDYLNDRDAQHAWVVLLMLNEQPREVEQSETFGLLDRCTMLSSLAELGELGVVCDDKVVPLRHY